MVGIIEAANSPGLVFDLLQRDIETERRLTTLRTEDCTTSICVRTRSRHHIQCADIQDAAAHVATSIGDRDVLQCKDCARVYEEDPDKVIPADGVGLSAAVNCQCPRA